MTKEFQNAIYDRNRLKNKMSKNRTINNITFYKRQQSSCVSLRRKNVKPLGRKNTTSFVNNDKKRELLQINTFGFS